MGAPDVWRPVGAEHPSSQPDYQTDFPGYARYITTSAFLASHLVGSIVGAGIGVIGAAALFVFASESAPARAAWGFTLTAFAQVSLASVFGVAAFFQPAIGRAFLEGTRDVAVAVNEDVYGGPLLATVGVSLLLFTGGAILLGMVQPVAGLGIAIAGVGFAVSAWRSERAPATAAASESLS